MGLGNLGQELNVSHVVLAHFQDDFFSVLGHVENGVRQANFIVVIALGLIGFIGCGKNGCNHVLGRGLPIGTSDCNHIYTKLV